MKTMFLIFKLASGSLVMGEVPATQCMAMVAQIELTGTANVALRENEQFVAVKAACFSLEKEDQKQ